MVVANDDPHTHAYQEVEQLVEAQVHLLSGAVLQSCELAIFHAS